MRAEEIPIQNQREEIERSVSVFHLAPPNLTDIRNKDNANYKTLSTRDEPCYLDEILFRMDFSCIKTSRAVADITTATGHAQRMPPTQRRALKPTTLPDVRVLPTSASAYSDQ